MRTVPENQCSPAELGAGQGRITATEEERKNFAPSAAVYAIPGSSSSCAGLDHLSIQTAAENEYCVWPGLDHVGGPESE